MIATPEMAATLYGSESAAQPAADAAPTPAPDSSEPAAAADPSPPAAAANEEVLELTAAEAINHNIPKELAERRGDPARKLFSDPQTIHAGAISDADFAGTLDQAALDATAAMFGVTSDQSAELAAHLADGETRAALVREVRETFGDLDLNAVESRDFIAACKAIDTTKSTADLWDSMVGDLNRTFGIRATEAFDAARELAQRDPRVGKFLSATGAGNQPGVVLALARAAMRVKGR